MRGFCPLASGSKGNCIFFGSDETKILIDAGIGPKIIEKRLEEIGVSLEEIDAILVTHEHTDHISGLSALGCRMGIPIFANRETAKGIYTQLKECPKFKIFSTGESFEFSDLEILPFSIKHDALDPVAFTIRMGEVKVGLCADLGFATSLVKQALLKCDYLYLEANHQPSMVFASSRPAVYKERVLSRLGHLSNEECGDLLVELFHPDLKHVHLAHLSSECNTPEVAIGVVEGKLKQKDFAVDLSIAHQDRISKVILF
ncbi:MAG: MBL fold metallo-hydrolase [Chlamydiales bacterium]